VSIQGYQDQGMESQQMRGTSFTGLAKELQTFVELFAVQFDKLLNEIHEEKNVQRLKD